MKLIAPPPAAPNSALNPLVSTVNSVSASSDGVLVATQELLSARVDGHAVGDRRPEAFFFDTHRVHARAQIRNGILPGLPGYRREAGIRRRVDDDDPGARDDRASGVGDGAGQLSTFGLA